MVSSGNEFSLRQTRASLIRWCREIKVQMVPGDGGRPLAFRGHACHPKVVPRRTREGDSSRAYGERRMGVKTPKRYHFDVPESFTRRADTARVEWVSKPRPLAFDAVSIYCHSGISMRSGGNDRSLYQRHASWSGRRNPALAVFARQVALSIVFWNRLWVQSTAAKAQRVISISRNDPDVDLAAPSNEAHRACV